MELMGLMESMGLMVADLGRRIAASGSRYTRDLELEEIIIVMEHMQIKRLVIAKVISKISVYPKK